jgi:hypothetical protein
MARIIKRLIKKIMKLYSILFYILGYIFSCHSLYGLKNTFTKKPLEVQTDYEWTIIGAGPAGIISIGILHDLGISLDEIMWIDPLFNVGRLGEYYSNVPGNAKNKLYVDFLKSCTLFNTLNTHAIQKLYSADVEECGILSLIIDPLQDITSYVKPLVNSIIGMMDYLEFYDDVWHVGSGETVFTSRNVILAIGSKPKVLDYESNCDIIPLDYALDKKTLHHMVRPVDSIVVVGSAHSAVLVLKFLTETSVKKIINLYKNPLVYAVDMGTWTLNATHGLKGTAAQWAKDVLENNPPPNLHRIINTDENRKKYMKECNKVIYAVGYERNSFPNIQVNNDMIELLYNPQTGVIGPRLFGIGIAFPSSYVDPLGEEQQSIGLNSFMKFAQAVIPQWICEEKKLIEESHYQQRLILEKFAELFEIYIL